MQHYGSNDSFGYKLGRYTYRFLHNDFAVKMTLLSIALIGIGVFLLVAI